MAEAENGNPVPFEAKVRAQIEKKIREADTDEKKTSLMQRLLQAIKEAVQHAQVAKEKAAQTSTPPAEAQQAKEKAAEPLLELLHLVNPQTPDANKEELIKKINLTEKQRSFLQQISTSGQNADTATQLTEVISKALNNENYIMFSAQGEAPTDFEKDLESIKHSPDAYNTTLQSVRQLVKDKRIKDTAGNTLSEADLDAKIAGVVQNETVNLSDLQEGINKLKAKRVEQERDQNSKLRTIREQIQQIQQDDTIDEPERQRKLEPLRAAEARLEASLDDIRVEHDAVSEYIHSGEVKPPFASAEAIEKYLTDSGLTDKNVRNINVAKGVNSFARGRGGRASLENGYTGYEDLGAVISQAYTYEKIKEKVFVGGKLDLDKLAGLQADLEDKVGVLFQNLYNSPKSEFGESFSSYSEGQMLRNIAQFLRTSIDGITNDPDFAHLSGDDKRTLKNTLNNQLIATLQRRPSIEQAVHKFLQIGSTIDLEKLKGVLSTYNIATLKEFYDDDLTRIMSDLMPEFIQKLILENNNEVISDLFQLMQVEKELDPNLVTSSTKQVDNQLVVKYREECIEYMLDVLNQMHEDGLLKQPVSKDNVNARFSRAYLDNFLLTLNGVKVLARAKPMRARFSDLPYGNIITGIYNPLHNWKPGLRGRGSQYEGDHEAVESNIGKYMYNEDAVYEWVKDNGGIYKDYHPTKEMKKAKDRLLYDLRPDNKELLRILKSGESDMFNSMLDVYSGLAVGNIVDQGGWTFDGLEETLNELSQALYGGKKYGDLSTKEQFELKYRTTGVVTAFWDVDGQAGNETKRQLKRHVAKDDIVQEERRLGRALTNEEKDAIVDKHFLQFGQQDYDNIFDKYAASDDRFKKIFAVKLGGKDTKVTLREYRAKRKWAIKGEVYHQMLLKDPLAWLGEMTHTFPEFQQGFVTYTDMQGQKNRVRTADFYFDLNKYPDDKISKSDKEARDRFRYEALVKFKGKEEDDYMSNVEHLQAIMNFYTNLIQSYMPEGSLPLENRPVDSHSSDQIDTAKKQAMDDLYLSLSLAHRKAAERYGEKTVKEDRIYEAMYGDRGLTTHFKKMVAKPNYFGDGENDLGEENGFYACMAQDDDRKNRRTQMRGDTNMKLLLKTTKNEQALERKLATNMTYAKAQEIIAQIPGICKEAGESKDFDSWYGKIVKIHEELKPLADEDQIIEQRYQMDAFMAVCHYFTRDSDVEKSLFTGWINEMKLGNDVAVVSIKADFRDRFMLDTDGRMTYLKKLRETNLLKGNYDILAGAGIGAAELVTGTNWFEIIKETAAVTIIAGMGLVVITAIQKGYEDEVDKKK